MNRQDLIKEAAEDAAAFRAHYKGLLPAQLIASLVRLGKRQNDVYSAFVNLLRGRSDEEITDYLIHALDYRPSEAAKILAEARKMRFESNSN
jgi:hypothetical protein